MCATQLGTECIFQVTCTEMIRLICSHCKGLQGVAKGASVAQLPEPLAEVNHVSASRNAFSSKVPVSSGY